MEHVYRLIDGMIPMIDAKEFENGFEGIYPAELELRKENAYENVATFLDLNIEIEGGQFSSNFSIVRLPQNCGNIPS